MVIHRLLLSLLCLLLLGSTVALAGPEREPRYLRLYMTDMHGWGEIREMSMVVGDTLFVSLIVEDAAGNPVQGARISVQSQRGNRATFTEGHSDPDGWIHGEVLATTPGDDRVRFRVGELHTDLKLTIVGDEADLPPTQGQLGAAQPLVVDYPGALPWEVLTDVTPGEDFGPAKFGNKISAHDGKTVIMQGFMLPLENTERQRHFVLSANPPHCYFCMPGGADSMVEIFAAQPLPFSYEPIVIEGTLQLVRGDEGMGLYYQIRGARQLQ